MMVILMQRSCSMSVCINLILRIFWLWRYSPMFSSPRGRLLAHFLCLTNLPSMTRKTLSKQVLIC